MTDLAKQPDPRDVDARCYLIRKQGYWYRPKASGYTSSAIQAGRYTLAEAERYTHPNGKDGPRDGMDYLHQDDVADPDWQAYLTQATTITALQAEVAALREALRQIYVDATEQHSDWCNMGPVDDEARNWAFDISQCALEALKP